MVNTEQDFTRKYINIYYNILNIVVNTEHKVPVAYTLSDYNILNIVVNTELSDSRNGNL